MSMNNNLLTLPDGNTSIETAATDDEQVITINSGNFITNQVNAKYSMYYVIYISTYGNKKMSIVDMTVNYTCKQLYLLSNGREFSRPFLFYLISS